MESGVRRCPYVLISVCTARAANARPEGLASRLNQLLGDDALCRSMGERSRALYEESFTLDHFLDGVGRVIQNCAVGTPGKS